MNDNNINNIMILVLLILIPIALVNILISDIITWDDVIDMCILVVCGIITMFISIRDIKDNINNE